MNNSKLICRMMFAREYQSTKKQLTLVISVMTHVVALLEAFQNSIADAQMQAPDAFARSQSLLPGASAYDGVPKSPTCRGSAPGATVNNRFIETAN